MTPQRRILIIISSILMLILAIPMLLWCLSIIDSAAMDYTYAGAGCFAVAIIYTFSMLTAIAGLAFAGRPYRHHWCRTLAYIQLAAGVILIVPLHAYAALTVPPLLIFTIIYLIGAKKRPDE
jgi:hypothetical protein